MKKIILTFLLFASQHFNVSIAQTSACLDSNFGQGGVMKVESGANYELGRSMAYQSDGRLIVCAEAKGGDATVCLKRFQPDGSLDPTFGTNGLVTFVNNNLKVAGDIIVLPNGQIVASASDFDYHYLYKFDPSGLPDISFGQNGIYAIPNVSIFNTYNTSLAMMPNGKFVASGNGYQKATLVRFNPNGSLDNTFGTGGVVVQNFPDFNYFPIKALAVDSFGAVFIGGKVLDHSSFVYDPYFLAKFKPNGSLDPAFGTNGIQVQQAVTDFSNEIRDIEVNTDGTIFTMIVAQRSNATHLLISKLLPSGAPDAIFGVNGSAHEIFPENVFPENKSIFNDLILLPNGNILVGGRITKDVALIQYLPSGTRLTSYGTNGILVTNFGGVANSETFQLLYHPFTGKIFSVGYTISSFPQESFEFLNKNEADIAMLRLNTDGNLDPSFGYGGKIIAHVFGAYENVEAFGRQPDGKLILVLKVNSSRTIVMRLLPDGSVDRSFSNFGKIKLEDLFTTSQGCIKMHNGKIYLVGSNYYADLICLLENGLPDLSFGINGKVEMSISDQFARGYAVEIQNNKIIMAGCYDCSGGNNDDFKIARFNNNGSIDASFGIGGIVSIAVGTSNDWARLMKVRPNGKIVVIGDSNVNGTSYASFAQLNSDGTLDNSFGINGKFIANSTGVQSFPSAAELLPDGKIILTTDITSMLAIRITENGALDLTYSQDGFIENYDVQNTYPITSGAMTTLNNLYFFGGNTHLSAEAMLTKTSSNGTISSPCGTPTTVWYADLFPGASEEIISLLADSDSSVVGVGEYHSQPFSSVVRPFLLRFLPEPSLPLNTGKDLNQPMSVQVMPNPATLGFWVEIPNKPSKGQFIVLSDALGRLILKTELTTERTWINRQGLPTGVYYLALIDNSQSASSLLPIIFID